MSDYQHTTPSGLSVFVPALECTASGSTAADFSIWQSMLYRAAKVYNALDYLKASVPEPGTKCSVEAREEWRRKRHILCQILIQTTYSQQLDIYPYMNKLEEDPCNIYHSILLARHFRCLGSGHFGDECVCHTI